MRTMQREEEFELVWESVRDNIPSNSKILITGANGLIASNLVETLMYFNKKYKTQNLIMALCRNKAKGSQRFEEFLGEEDFLLVVQDVCCLNLSIKPDYIIHAASNAHPMAYSVKPIETMKTNILGTINILDFASDNKAQKVVYVSTSEIYGEGFGDSTKFVENDYGSVNTLTPRSCYSESKRCAETFCACYAKEKGLDISIVRPGYIYGAQITADNSRADAQFLRNVLKGENIILKSEGLQTRSYCYVMDAVSAILAVFIKGGSGEAYNIANSSSEASVKEFAETMATIGNTKVVFDIPTDVEKNGYSVIKNSLLDDSKLIALGWKPLYDLESGLRQTILQSRNE